MADKTLKQWAKTIELPKTAIELTSGAEASIYQDNEVVFKLRSPKTYRHETIDVTLRKTRSRKEAKVLLKLKELGVPAPELIAIDERAGIIEMSFIKGEKVRDVLEKHIHFCKLIGEYLAIMHNNDLVHGDLTTSNMIFNDGNIVFIDFGLAFTTTRLEDKAVDVHLFKQALASKHYTVDNEAWDLFLEGYQLQEREQILDRLAEVELRGRNKHG